MHRVILSSGTAISAIFIGIQVFIFNSGIINTKFTGGSIWLFVIGPATGLLASWILAALGYFN